ncbi:MAG: Polyketide cyclase/dehydrase [Solirubrobacterales bacterium]|nr:Polyketide cyclase/dehydrase [Solirubrobacterales bacterium]
MAINEITVDGTPKDVFDVLRDPYAYPKWVLGAKRVRDVDDGFPQPGTRFHHSVGIGPLELDDHTEVLEYTPDERLVLKAKTRPFGTARVTMEAQPVGNDRTRVVMDEVAGDPISRALYNPLVDALMKGRNAEALRRFAELVRERHMSRVA